MLSNAQIAQIFLNIADSLELLGENKFKYLAYRRAGDMIAGMSTSIADVWRADSLRDLPGIGPAIAGKIDELLRTGQLALYEELKAAVPPGVVELMRVPEIGPKTAARLFHEVGIQTIDQLRQAASSGTLREIKGMGAKTEQRILHGLNALQQEAPRPLLATALPVARELAAVLRAADPRVSEVEPTGSLRRARPTVGDIDLLAASPDPAATVAAFLALPQVAQAPAHGDRKATVLLHNGLQADLLVVEPARWGSGLQHFTGSRQHNIRFRELALERGLSFSEAGFKRADGSELLCASEAEVYATLDMAWVPPEIREHWGEIECARAGQLPRLVERADLCADLHMHSRWSDGRGSIREMVAAARALGYSYMAISDHSAYMGVTGGLHPADVARQRAEIDEINAELAAAGSDFCVLHSCEVDILPDGALALPDAVLAQLDLVIASPHVALRQPAAAATARMLRAARHPLVHLIAHPTGRLLNSRAGQEIDMPALLATAAECGTALEVNAGPDRLDLDAEHVRAALALGIPLAISSDAHHPDGLAGIELGVLTARRGWATAPAVINTWPLPELRRWLDRKRAR